MNFPMAEAHLAFEVPPTTACLALGNGVVAAYPSLSLCAILLLSLALAVRANQSVGLLVAAADWAPLYSHLYIASKKLEIDRAMSVLRPKSRISCRVSR